jgi:hypothetical protein
MFVCHIGMSMEVIEYKDKRLEYLG